MNDHFGFVFFFFFNSFFVFFFLAAVDFISNFSPFDAITHNCSQSFSCYISMLHFNVTFRCYISMLHFVVTFRCNISMLHFGRLCLSIYCQTNVYMFIFAPCNVRPSTLQTVLLHLENAQTQLYFKRYYLWHWDLSSHKFARWHRGHDKRWEYFSVYSIEFDIFNVASPISLIYYAFGSYSSSSNFMKIMLSIPTILSLPFGVVFTVSSLPPSVYILRICQFLIIIIITI